MKKGIHPQWKSDAKVVLNGKAIMTVGSTKDELQVEIWSGNHPFYTGQEMLVDTDNLVEKFNKKMEASKKTAGNLRSKKEKRQNRRRSNVSTNQVTLKDMLNSVK